MPLKRCAKPGCLTEYFYVTEEGQVLCADCRTPLLVIPGLPNAALDEIWVALDDRRLFYNESLNGMKANDYLRPFVERRITFLDKIVAFFTRVAAVGYAAEQEKFSAHGPVADDGDDEEDLEELGE